MRWGDRAALETVKAGKLGIAQACAASGTAFVVAPLEFAARALFLELETLLVIEVRLSVEEVGAAAAARDSATGRAAAATEG